MGISKAQVEKACQELNKIMGRPLKPYDENINPNAGHFFIDYGHGGGIIAVMLKSGGITAVQSYVRKPKSVLLEILGAMIWAAEEMKNRGV